MQGGRIRGLEYVLVGKWGLYIAIVLPSSMAYDSFKILYM